MRRRDFLPALAAPLALAQTPEPVKRKGRIKQGVTRGVFGRGMSMEDCCREAARLGIKGYDLIGPQDWPTLKKYGLTPTMYPPPAGGNDSRRAQSQGESREDRAADARRRSMNAQAERRARTSSRSPATARAWTTAKARTTASRS